jgi:addiction module RelE/StbE family toxin
MAKKVVWSLRAQKDRKSILEYWRERNRSVTYSRKLNLLFKEAVSIIRKFPQIGKPTDYPNVRIKVVKDYLIIYEVTATTIYILTIWDSRQDPDKMEKLLK